MPTLADQLRACPLFSQLTPSQLDAVARFSRLVHVRAGEMIIRETQPCEGFYVVAGGTVRIYKIAPDGRERTLHVVRPPQSFAEAAMFGGQAYPAFAEAIEDSQVILVRRDPFLRMLREQPDCSLLLFESLSRWLHRLLDQLENESFLNARAKLASYLLREARRQTGKAAGTAEIELTLAKKDVASQLGMAPETFSRAQADLESRGLIRPTGRRIKIVDVAAVESLLLGEPEG